MAILKMKRLDAIVPVQRRRSALRSLSRLGCVELESGTGLLPQEAESFLRSAEENTGASETRSCLVHAMDALGRYSPCKTGLFTPRKPLTEQELFDPARLEEAYARAKEVVALNAKIDEAAATQNRLGARIAALTPWEPLDVPLDYTGGALTSFHTGVLPAAAGVEQLAKALADGDLAAELAVVSSDREQHYLTLLAYKPDEDAALSLVKSSGFMPANFREYKSTALEAVASLRGQITTLDGQIQGWEEGIRAYVPHRELIQSAIDAYVQEDGRDRLLSTVGRTGTTVVLTGWAPEEAIGAVSDVLEEEGCAFAFSDPEPEDNIPTALKNNSFVEPFTAVTEMYGTLQYSSLVDTNPVMSVFYIIFFGFMMGDAVYGLLIALGCWFYLKKKRPAGSMRKLLTMFMYCGVSSILAGVLTGSYLSDFVQAVSGKLGNPVAIPPLLFDPLAEPMSMLGLSLGLGVVQLITGMALSARRSMLKGDMADAFFSVGSWYITFIGLGMFVLNVPVGMYVMLAGLALVAYNGMRGKKGLGMITGAFGALYNGVTGNLSDVLSYSRIMALCLSGAVVGQVMNQLATMGDGILGVILFIIIIPVGHIFNLVLNILSAFVHSSRLQFIEFFGRCFEDGGRPFRPLWNNTKYVEIVKEEYSL